MKNKPNPNTIFPLPNINTLTFVKPTIKNPNIVVGDFTYFADTDFEKHVTHHYDFIGDKLIIGKFCQIGAGVEVVMNGANHQMNAVSTYLFTFSALGTNPHSLKKTCRSKAILSLAMMCGLGKTPQYSLACILAMGRLSV